MVANNGQRARILHLSDLHFGTGFDNDAWKNVRNKAKEITPNLVIVTGDLVNSPWRWRMKWAKKELTLLRDSLGCDVVVCPGNHDTRVLGIVPVAWLEWILIGLSVVLMASFFFLIPYFPIIGSVILVLGALVVVGVILFGFFTADFAKYFEEFHLPSKSAFKYENLGIELYAFDSATQALSGARGRISLAQFVEAQGTRAARISQLAGNSEDKTCSRSALYRIAILHHHPLPIPYDDDAEPLMVADNAGAFLSEVSRLKVRLILHGHKHRRHFSRITINACDQGEYEVAVLSTGTATHGPGTQKRGHNFNFLELCDDGNMKVTPYVAEGGTFAEKPGGAFFVELDALVDQRRYQAEVETHGIECDATVVKVEIRSDGDMNHRHEFRGFRVTREGGELKELPEPIQVEVTNGQIEGLKGKSLDQHSREKVTLIADKATSLSKQTGRISFGRNLLPKDKALSFYFEYTGLNVLAMTRQQHFEMYGEKPERTEYVEVALRQCPTKELNIIVTFPPDFKMGGAPQLLLERAGNRVSELEEKYKDTVRYYPDLRAIISRIPLPPLGLTYKIEWHLTEVPPHGGFPTSRLVGEAEEIASGLLRGIEENRSDVGIQNLLKGIAEQTRLAFPVLKGKPEEKIDISLMAYDKNERLLRIVAANFALDESMREFKLRYGDGIAGRAYKMNAGRAFLKRPAVEHDLPSYYFPVDGKPYRLKDVTDQVIISIPLRHPNQKSVVYGVLSLSSKKLWSMLLDLVESPAFEESPELLEYQAAIGKACYQVFEERILRDGA